LYRGSTHSPRDSSQALDSGAVLADCTANKAIPIFACGNLILDVLLVFEFTSSAQSDMQHKSGEPGIRD
jgi:hypothetical protein